MQLSGADCKDLISRTTAALSNETLEHLFVSTQKNNIEVCIEYAIKRYCISILDNQNIPIPVFRAIVANTMLFAGGKHQSLFSIGKEKTTLEGLLESICLWFPNIVVCLPRKMNKGATDRNNLELVLEIKNKAVSDYVVDLICEFVPVGEFETLKT